MKKKTLTTLVTLIVLATVFLIKEHNIAELPFFTNKQEQHVNASSNNELAALEYDGENQVVILENNQPNFSNDDLKKGQNSRQWFTDLDSLNRVGEANAVLSKELMPTSDREPLYVDPTGWKNKKLSSGWLYNRCHLIGYQLTGENNNLKNLMTGTRSLNTPAMLDYENKVANYVKTTGNQVRYRVTPVFSGDELVARGVQMEAQSIQDDKIKFNIYIFNVEKGVKINYSTGNSTLEK